MAIPITRAQIPDSALADLETLAAWANSTLEFMANGVRYQEVEGVTTFRHEKSIFADYLKQQTYSARASYQLQPDWSTGNYGGLWAAVNPILDGTIPAEFLQP